MTLNRRRLLATFVVGMFVGAAVGLRYIPRDLATDTVTGILFAAGAVALFLGFYWPVDESPDNEG